MSKRWTKERCRFVQEMHESPNCARDTGQEEKDNPMHALADAAGCKKRRASTLEQRRGARCLQYEPRKALVSGRMSRN